MSRRLFIDSTQRRKTDPSYVLRDMKKFMLKMEAHVLNITSLASTISTIAAINQVYDTSHIHSRGAACVLPLFVKYALTAILHSSMTAAMCVALAATLVCNAALATKTVFCSSP